MPEQEDETKKPPAEFDFSAFPANTLFHDRRTGQDRRGAPGKFGEPDRVAPASPPAPRERRARKERRKRVDPTTFEKQYNVEEIEFMNAIQEFKDRTRKTFPSYGEALRVAVSIGYRRVVED